VSETTSSQLEVRGDPATIDAPWMTDALSRAGVARGATVTDVALEGFIGTGQTGRNARFLLTWDQPAGRPTSVVGKFSSADPAAREAAFGNGTYRNEWAFYTNLASTLRVRCPVCHVAAFDADAPDFVLLMEDLAGSCQGDQFAGLTADQAALGVTQAVGIHAPRWGDPTLAGFNPERPSGDDRGLMLGAIYDMTMEPFLDRLGPRLDDDIVDLVRRLAPHVGSWALASDTPRTVVHLDFRPDNFMFGVTPEAPPLVVVDWQTVAEGSAMWDLAYMIGGSFEGPARAAVERDLLGEYVSQMAAAGVAYDRNTCWRDYRLGALWGLVMTVIATILAAETERGNDMLTTMGQRHGRHALDLESLSLLG
jgi:hypothetical protein